MPEPKKLKMCPDPDCGHESPEESETCPKCGIDFEAFSNLDKILSVRERIAAKAKKPEPPAKKKSLLDSWKRGAKK